MFCPALRPVSAAASESMDSLSTHSPASKMPSALRASKRGLSPVRLNGDVALTALVDHVALPSRGVLLNERQQARLASLHGPPPLVQRELQKADCPARSTSGLDVAQLKKNRHPRLHPSTPCLCAQGLGVEKKVKGAGFEGVDAVKQRPGFTSLRRLRAVWAPHARTDDVALERAPVLETYLALVHGRDRCSLVRSGRPTSSKAAAIRPTMPAQPSPTQNREFGRCQPFQPRR